MRSMMRCVAWRGQMFRFQRMTGGRAGGTLDWAVSSGFEFIGTMACVGDVTTGEFEVRCLRWLTELLQ